MKKLSIVLSVVLFLVLSCEAFSFFPDRFPFTSGGKSNVKEVDQVLKEIIFNEAADDDRNTYEIDDELFDQIGSSSDLNSLMKTLGIREEEPSEPLVFREPEASISLRSGGVVLSEKKDHIIVPQISTRTRKPVKYIKNPVAAHCQPDLKPVDLGLKSTKKVVFYPTCVRVMQCGGCCSNEKVFECQPIASEKVFVKVLELRKTSSRTNRDSRRRRRSRVHAVPFNITVEEHTECSCMCRSKEDDCDLSIQNFDINTCSCSCKNSDEREKCLNKASHLWNNEKCKCLCRNTEPCSSGQQFDHNTCSCKGNFNGPTLWDDFFHSRSANGKKRMISTRVRKPISVPLE